MLVEAICQHQPDAVDVQRLCATWSASQAIQTQREAQNARCLPICADMLCWLSWVRHGRNDVSESEELSDDRQS